MITPIVKDTKVVFGPCRLSYTHVFSKYVEKPLNFDPFGQVEFAPLALM